MNPKKKLLILTSTSWLMPLLFCSSHVMLQHSYQALDIACSLLLPSHVRLLDKWLLLRTRWQKRAPIQHRSKPQCMTNHKKRLSFPLEPVSCLELEQSRGLEIKGKGQRQEEKKKQSSVNWYVDSFVVTEWISFIPGAGIMVHASLLFISK
jgi:hypothetical protein